MNLVASQSPSGRDCPAAQPDMAPAVIDRLVCKLQALLPDLLAVYGFGSRVQGTARQDSDLDMAVLVAGHADPVLLWEWAGELADMAGCPVDLLDLRAASTVMQYQITTTGVHWWALDAQAALFESAILSQKAALDTARAGLLSYAPESASDYCIGKAIALERYVARAREEYFSDPATFASNFTRQDAAILDIQRAYEAALDMGQHLIRRDRLGVPQGARDVFALFWHRPVESNCFWPRDCSAWSGFSTLRCTTTRPCNCPSPSPSSKSTWISFCTTARPFCRAMLSERAA